MKTNSPNPVDGDVQSLIADCKSEIKYLKGQITRCNKYRIGLSDYESQLKRQQVALAALTAVPDHYKIDVYRGDRLIASCHPSEPEGSPAEEPYRFVETAYYTTPPAHLLRPVELPGGFSPAIGDIFDRQAPVMRRDREEGCWIHKAVVAELLRSLGHEVK